ncbi:MAG: hypothetical protein N4A64_11495 [Marinisporobacter sp.]|nr:hypothetical protein [Marinisporobacter sp.]
MIEFIYEQAVKSIEEIKTEDSINLMRFMPLLDINPKSECLSSVFIEVIMVSPLKEVTWIKEFRRLSNFNSTPFVIEGRSMNPFFSICNKL